MSLNREIKLKVPPPPPPPTNVLFYGLFPLSCLLSQLQRRGLRGISAPAFAPQNTSPVSPQAEKPDYQISVAVCLCWSADLISASFHGGRPRAGRTLQRLTDRRLRSHKAESFTHPPPGSCHSNVDKEQPLYFQRSPPSDPRASA